MTVRDFNIRISSFDYSKTVEQNIIDNASGTSLYDKWFYCTIKQKINNISTFLARFGGISGTPFRVNHLFGVYYNNGSTTRRVFIGFITRVSYETYDYIEVEGMDMSYLLSHHYIFPVSQDNKPYTTPPFSSTNQNFTLQNLVNVLNSRFIGDDQGNDKILPLGTIDDIVLGRQIEIPTMNKQQAFFYCSRLFPSHYFFIDEATGQINVRTNRGSQSTVYNFYLTGSNTNAYLGKRHFTNTNIANHVTVIGNGNKFITTYSDYTTKESRLVSGDKRLARPCRISYYGGSDTTMFLNSTEGLPSSGRVILRGGGLISYNPVFTKMDAEVDYTGKTSNALTGCSVVMTLPLGDAIFEVGTPVYLADKVFVESTSSFSSSGAIRIGNEIINYSSKGSNFFNVSRGNNLYIRGHIAVTSLTSNISASDTTIPVSSTSGFADRGIIAIMTEHVYYNSKTSTSFTNCVRYRGEAHSTGEPVTQVSFPEVHPNGVIVKQETWGQVDETDSSIKLNGLRSLVIQEPALLTKEDVEMYASNVLLTQRWGDVLHEIYPQDVGGVFDVLKIGDRVSIFDGRLNVTFDAKVVAMDLVLNRETNYALNILTAPYSTARGVNTKTLKLSDYLEAMRNSRWV